MDVDTVFLLEALENGFPFVVVVSVILFFAFGDAIQRRLRDEDAALLDQRLHVAEEESQQQRANVRAVHVGVGHDNDFAVTNFARVKIFAADAGAECGDNSADFLIGKNFIQPCFFHVQNFAFDWQNGLEATVASLFGRTAGGVALNNVNLAMLRIGDAAISQFAGKATTIDAGFAPRQLTRLARGFARARGEQAFFDNLARNRGGLFKIGAQTLANDRFDDAAHFTVAKLGFGLAFELRLSHLDAQYGGQTFAHIVAGELNSVLFFNQIIFSGVGVDRFGQCRLKADEMRAAFDGMDVVDISKNIFVVAIIVLQGNFDRHALAFALEVDRLVHDRLACFVKILDELRDAALKLKLV